MASDTPSDPFDFSDQVVVVTGSSSGIGEACVREFARRGAHVVVNSSSSVEAGTRLAEELPSARYVQADVSLERDCVRLVEAAVDRWGRLDHLINNAGTTAVIPHHDFDALTDEVWDRILKVNLLGTFYMSRAALPHLRKQRGSIVNVTSIAGVRQVGSSIPYAVSKAALNHLTRLMANQTGPEVRINAVAPGLVATPWTAEWDEAHARVAEQAPMARSATPEDIALACLAFAANTYTTGDVMIVDGGVTLRG